jgi:DNA-directed RNA polymerase subunit RPC12/RpoP
MVDGPFPMPFGVQVIYRCATCKKFASKQYVNSNQLCEHCDGKFEVIAGKKLPPKGMGIFTISYDLSFISDKFKSMDYQTKYMATFIPDDKRIHSLKGI